MRTPFIATAVLLVCLPLATAGLMVHAQSQPSSQSQTSTPPLAFDVVSIKVRVDEANSGSVGQLPDGTFRLVNSGLSTLVSDAYPGMAEIIGLPEWAHARYDVIAKTTVTAPTADQRREMMRTLLAERLKFAAHVEKRDQPTFDLVLARSDGRLGASIQRTAADCDTPSGRRAAAALPLPSGSEVPACGSRMTDKGVEGDMTMAGLASTIKMYAGRHVMDKTGLTGRYRVKLEVSLFSIGADPNAAGIDAPVTIFTALTDQLGLKLQPSRAPLDVLVIDRMERPREN